MSLVEEIPNPSRGFEIRKKSQGNMVASIGLLTVGMTRLPVAAVDAVDQFGRSLILHRLCTDHFGKVTGFRVFHDTGFVAMSFQQGPVILDTVLKNTVGHLNIIPCALGFANGFGF